MKNRILTLLLPLPDSVDGGEHAEESTDAEEDRADGGDHHSEGEHRTQAVQRVVVVLICNGTGEYGSVGLYTQADSCK